jgi:hypothetical protein
MNESGLSLVAVLVSVGLLAVVGFGVASLSQQVSQMGRNASSQSGRSALEAVLQKVLARKSLCDAMITAGTTIALPAGSQPGTTNLTIDLLDGPTTGGTGTRTIVSGGATLPKFNVAIPAGGFSFVIPAGSTGTPSAPPLLPGTLWTGLIELQLQQLGNAVGGVALQRRTIGTLTVVVNGANQFVECDQFALSGPVICNSIGGTWNGTSCALVASSPCAVGEILAGPALPANCKSCAANQVLVFDGLGNFTCQPYP